jgi:acyl-CoA synthetase (AMP-forming)/AMP-acid ligase II
MSCAKSATSRSPARCGRRSISHGSDASRSGEIRDKILADCRASLAPHKVPAMIKFVSSLDITAAGKLARHDA